MAKFVVNLKSLLQIRNLPKLLINRKIMTTPQRYEEVLDNLKQNTYYEKYAEKIAKLQQTSPEEFLSRIDSLEKQKQPKKQQKPIDNKYSQLLKPKAPIGQVETVEAPLDKIMKVDLIRDKTTEEIREIWQKYHLEKNYIAAIIPHNDYEVLYNRGIEFPTFLLPLPREQGYEFIMLQFEKNCVHFTPLLYYQVHKENAPECLTITHYTELKDSKNIVLMRGEYDQNIISLKEAQCLANELKMYYVTPNDEKLRLLECFNKRPDQFKHMDLIKQIESLSL